LPRGDDVAHEYTAAVASSAAVLTPASARIFAVGASPTADDEEEADEATIKKHNNNKGMRIFFFFFFFFFFSQNQSLFDFSIACSFFVSCSHVLCRPLS
jgi:hypothetical protein